MDKLYVQPADGDAYCGPCSRPSQAQIDVVELEEFLELRKSTPVIDHVMHLSNLWLDGGKWEPQVVAQDKCEFDDYPGEDRQLSV